MQGLEEFSHLWIFFIFDQYIGNYCKVRAKNDCPKAEDKKGVFGTRSPCRFNPIGLSPAKILSVDPSNGTVLVSGIDLVNGTPIIDLKPYIGADVVAEAKFAPWLKDDSGERCVKISPSAAKAVQELVSEGKLKFYKRAEEVVELVVEVLKQNPHSKSAVEGKKAGVFALALDNMEVVYRVNAGFNEFEVLRVIECKNEEQIKKLRTKEWLEETSVLLSK